jgi:hypothetical protein
MSTVLLTTVHQPLGVDSHNSTRNMQAEMYNAQVTVSQGAFSIRGVCTGWGLEFIAANLKAPTTVLHYPTLRRIRRELERGYDYLGIGFSICTFPKALEVCKLARACAPQTKIVLGGYGTVLPECDRYADHVCREEGVHFFKRLLKEEQSESFTLPVITRRLKVLSVSTKPELIVPTGLGCSRGCDFCCTSHFFDRKYVPLIRTGKEIHDFICSADIGKSTYRDVGIIDEDFLLDRRRGRELAEWNSREVEKPILFSCLTSAKSIAQYSTDELLRMGLAGVWLGIESRRATYAKLKDIDIPAMISRLKDNGINVLTSMILGYDWHDPETVEEDFQYLLSLKPTLSQMMLYGPCPQTPLYERMRKAGRLLDIPYHHCDGFHLLFTHPHFSSGEIETLLVRLFEREYEELGPCIFRVMEVQMNGFERLRESDSELYLRRALEHQRMAVEIFPLLRVGISNAPSTRVRVFLQSLRDRAEALLPLPISVRSKEVITPVLYHYTAWRRKFAYAQPRQEVHRYRQQVDAPLL